MYRAYRAERDDRLGVRVVARSELIYAAPPAPGTDRPAHVRAASGLVLLAGALWVIQDDTGYLARIDPFTLVALDAVALPLGPGGRRFEAALGNRLAKPDFEACLVLDGELLGFGSGSAPTRERIVRFAGGVAAIVDGHPLYTAVGAALGGQLNLEGAARVGDELWLFHRGNTGPDDPGPAIARLPIDDIRAWRDHGVAPVAAAVDRYDLGATHGVRLGFTDADATHDRVVFVAAAEASPDAVVDGRIVDAVVGVIDQDIVRTGPLRLDGATIKAEGIVLDPRDPTRAWIVIDRDDPDAPAVIYAVELVGPW